LQKLKKQDASNQFKCRASHKHRQYRLLVAFLMGLAHHWRAQQQEFAMLRGTMLPGICAAMIVAIFLNCSALAVPQDAQRPLLDSDGLLPPSRDPADVPSAADQSVTVPAVPMTDLVRQAIRLFDSGSNSHGLTFGFGNWPQPEIGEFFGALMVDQTAGPAFIKRMVEVFSSNQAAWAALKNQAAIEESTPIEVGVRRGVEKLLVKSKMKRAPVTNAGAGCKPMVAKGVAFYQDNRTWFVPVWSRAGRDPAIVAFQVAYWDRDVLEPAVKNAKAMGSWPERSVPTCILPVESRAGTRSSASSESTTSAGHTPCR
jgi:hypothetical protein